jgi:drug/metabolite transporter (DMT)-like permease
MSAPRKAGILMPHLTAAEYARGVAYGLGAVLIWGGWMVLSRLGMKSTLTPWDMVALRVGLGGLLLLPVLWQRGLARDRLGWSGLAMIMLGGGAPLVLLVNVGLLFAPAAHAGALFPGVMPLMVAVLAAIFLGETFTRSKAFGFTLVLAGALGIVAVAGGTLDWRQNFGHACFLGAALLWAFYVIALRRAQLDGLHAAAIAAVASLVVYVPIYVLFLQPRIFQAPPGELALHAVVQGVLTAVVSLVLHGRAVAILGASSASALSALSPALTAVLAIPVLGEVPPPLEWIAIALVSAGVWFISGGPYRKTAAPPPA